MAHRPGRGARLSRFRVLLSAVMGLTAATTPVSAGSPAGIDTAAVAARVLPAVVSITTRHVHEESPDRRVLRRGLGSGVIVDRRGYILTNYHVSDDSEHTVDQIKVTLTDERAFVAHLVGADPALDLAVLKIEAQTLPTARFAAASARLRIGEPVIAIGNPLWIEGGPSVTAGVVSGLDRIMEQPGLPVLHHLVQTDAAINDGNSGGPLVNRTGLVVGISTATIASANGIGFAIPAHVAKPILDRIVAHGSIVRPALGLIGVSVTPQVAFVEDLDVEHGVLIVEVDANRPAARAGLKARDIIVAIERRTIRGLREYHEALWSRRPGDAIDLIVRRHGEHHVVQAILDTDTPRARPWRPTERTLDLPRRRNGPS